MTDHVHRVLNKANQDCNLNGLRLTEKRRNVLQILLEAGEPLSAYEIAEKYRPAIGQPLSAMSAYRMLDFLLQAGLIHKLETTNQYVACSHIACEHTHEIPQFLICDQCHSVQEVGIRKALLMELQASVADSGFEIDSLQLELHGLCQQCRSQQQ